MRTLDLRGKKVLLRADMNVPINGDVRDDQRIKACLPTIHEILRQNAAAIVLSHLGRPQENKPQEKFSLAPVAKRLEELTKRKVRFVKDYLNGVDAAANELLMCENLRFNAGELDNNQELAQRLAKLGDVFVMDAFAVAHRKHASTCGVTRYSKVARAGPLLCREVNTLKKIKNDAKRPLLVIIGGSKVSTKFGVIDAFANQADCLLVGGGIANTFLAAAGHNVGTSLYEPKWMDAARKIMEKMKQRKKLLALPKDVIWATAGARQTTRAKVNGNIASGDMIMDIGEATIKQYRTLISQVKTILWCGPMGVFEDRRFAAGTRSVAAAIAASSAYSVAGGGDTLAALAAFDIGGISYTSTGGGAFLEFMEHGRLAALTELGYKGN